MNDEIREILDKLRSDDYYEKEYQKSVYYERDLKKLLDYITNLQKENERLKNRNDFLNSVCVGFDDKYEDYKSRVEKAVEYIKNKLSFETYQHLKKLYYDIDSIEEIWEDYEFEDLLNILQNGDDEE